MILYMLLSPWRLMTCLTSCYFLPVIDHVYVFGQSQDNHVTNEPVGNHCRGGGTSVKMWVALWWVPYYKAWNPVKKPVLLLNFITGHLFVYLWSRQIIREELSEGWATARTFDPLSKVLQLERQIFTLYPHWGDWQNLYELQYVLAPL